MKYTIAAILVVATALLIWVAREGTGTDVAIMVVAIISVTFFASMGNMWNSMYKKHKIKRVVDRSNATVVRAPAKRPSPVDQTDGGGS